VVACSVFLVFEYCEHDLGRVLDTHPHAFSGVMVQSCSSTSSCSQNSCPACGQKQEQCWVLFAVRPLSDVARAQQPDLNIHAAVGAFGVGPVVTTEYAQSYRACMA
jgi:hypothetical protein